MTDTAPVKTLILAVAMFVFCVFFGVTLDFGYTDMFYHPMMYCWFGFTLASFLPVLRHPVFRFFRRAWWLQLFVPILLWLLAGWLTQGYRHPR